MSTITGMVMMSLGINEAITGDAISSASVAHAAFDTVGLQLPTATIPTTKVSFKTYSLVAGTKTIDLRALPGIENVSQDCDGLKVRAFIFKNPAGNGTMTVAAGSSNGYDIDTFKVRGNADNPQTKVSRETFGTVDGTHKTIDVTGTGTQSFSFGLVLG